MAKKNGNKFFEGAPITIAPKFNNEEGLGRVIARIGCSEEQLLGGKISCRSMDNSQIFVVVPGRAGEVAVAKKFLAPHLASA